MQNTGLEDEFQTIHEFIQAARINLNANVWDYLVGGTETETTLARNRAALDQIALRPRVLNDVSDVDTGHVLFGKKVALPIILAPVGSLEQFDPGGGVTVAEAAGRANVAMMLSSVTTKTLPDVRAKTRAPLIYQLYIRGDAAFVDEQVAYAVDSGADAFCITVDTQHYSRRERDIAKRFTKTWRNASFTGDAKRYQAQFSWKDVARFKARHDIPFILKGIGTAEDARIAVEHGVDVIYCSNHGGRQLDHGRGSADVVQEVIDAVGGKARVVMDGGVSRGTDIVKMMALGCDGIGIGRLYCYGLAARGADGVVRLLEILQDEVTIALGLAGVSRYSELNRKFLYFGAPIVAQPGALSAFPLLDLDAKGY